jgi:hypothetical protein
MLLGLKNSTMHSAVQPEAEWQGTDDTGGSEWFMKHCGRNWHWQYIFSILKKCF